MKKQITKGKVIQRCIKVMAAVVVAGGVGFQFHEIQELNKELTVLTSEHQDTVQELQKMNEENVQVRDQYSVLASESEKLLNDASGLKETNESLKKENDSLLKEKAALQGEKKKLETENKGLYTELQEERDRPRQVTTSSADTPKTAAPAQTKTESAPVAVKNDVKKQTTVQTASVKKTSNPVQSVSQVINGQATAYNANCEGCSGITASGKKVGPGMIAMADWVPLGTKVRITCPSYPSINGVYTVEDRGGAIKGNKVDIFVHTYDQAIDFGRRDIQIEILK